MTTAYELIANCSALLLDFDGPMAALMPPPLNAQAAERVRHAAAAYNSPQRSAPRQPRGLNACIQRSGVEHTLAKLQRHR